MKTLASLLSALLLSASIPVALTACSEDTCAGDSCVCTAAGGQPAATSGSSRLASSP